MIACKSPAWIFPTLLLATALLPGPALAQDKTQDKPPATVSIPGSLQGFQRMTAVSRKASAEDLLPFLARNVVIDGYQRRQGQDPQPTEYLKLIKSYLEQARALKDLAGPSGQIDIKNCTDVAHILKTIGFRFRNPCGPSATVETEIGRAHV